MPRTIVPLLMWALMHFANTASAQELNNFRFVGDSAPASAGTVTSITLAPVQANGKLNFFNAAGLSSVYDIRFTPSEVIRQGVPVFMPSAGFGIDAPANLNLDGVEFYSGSLAGDGSSPPPVNWFRMIRYNGRWSGVFRVSNRIYSIDRYRNTQVIDVRSTPLTSRLRNPSRRVKVSAVIDEQYVFADSIGDLTGMDNQGHLFALESLHILDGLSTDSLGLSIAVEQVIYQNSDVLISQSLPADTVLGAEQWLTANSLAFGLDDNLALFVFRGGNSVSAINLSTGTDVIVQGNSPDYQFASAHFLGTFLGLTFESGTLSQRTPSAAISLPYAHWSEQQRQNFEVNPTTPSKTQALSFDEPEVPSQPEVIDEVAAPLIDSDEEEAVQNDILQDDGASNEAAAPAGGALDIPGLLILFLLPVAVRRYAR